MATAERGKQQYVARPLAEKSWLEDAGKNRYGGFQHGPGDIGIL